MADATEAFFAELGGRGHEPLLTNASGTMRFDLHDGKKVDHWFVSVTKGDITVSRRNVKADCLLSGDKALFERVATGKTNAMAALLRGALDAEGDVELLVLFQRLFPGPPRARRRRSPAATRRKK